MPFGSRSPHSVNHVIWVTGRAGMLGRELLDTFASAGVAATGTGREVDIANPEAVAALARQHLSPATDRWIINCAGFTAVDEAESKPEEAFRSNAVGPGVLGEAAAALGANLVHFSTDYVFDGKLPRPYREDDPPGPLSVYGKTKLEGEVRVRAACPRHFIFRLSWLYGHHGRNFVKTIVRLMNEREEVRVVSDQIGAPTYCRALARNILGLVSQGSTEFGTYHYSDEAEISWYDFAVTIGSEAHDCGLVKKIPRVVPITSAEFPTPAQRPENSRFDLCRVRGILGFHCPEWRASLSDFFSTWPHRL